MKIYSVLLTLALGASMAFGFVPTVPTQHAGARTFSPTAMYAKYNTMDEILALFPADLPVLINFYDAATENAIKDDIFRAKQLLKDRATVVSIKQQGN